MSLAGRYVHLERQPTTRQERAMQHPQSTRALASSHALSSLGLAHRLPSILLAQSWLASTPRIGSAPRSKESNQARAQVLAVEVSPDRVDNDADRGVAVVLRVGRRDVGQRQVAGVSCPASAG